MCLKSYIQESILPLYHRHDRAHGIVHANEVIDFSLRIAALIPNLNLDIVYAAAAYHDIGLGLGHRDIHHELSGEFVLQDQNLLHFFTIDQIQTISTATKEHRASANAPASSIYSSILADADKAPSYSIERVLVRAFLYRSNSPLSIEEKFQDIYDHVFSKYGHGGYAKIRLPETRKIIQPVIDNTATILADKRATYNLYLSLVS